MGISKFFNTIGNYISEAVARIFGPNDDRYPATGVQPFSGDPVQKKQESDW
ncbi:MAG: hypothetical protein SAL07_00235 [Oscillatoria sp. PMC 1051.18]|uniref:hypothetical protein n=1 Tax=Oscillatoria salina TaxID=331517 RepID=UPI001CCBD6A2|nr:hypothetical protein [Oscillatoria salina]MEC4891735.1 hypothetical protein [Oscillatoria sp. PMC 1050.18]MEC5028313.1 hypothetical protein [Oscillatoria sp. PMC 1051.18]